MTLDFSSAAPGFPLEGGSPAGGTYYVDGMESDSLFPYLMDEGVHEIVYQYRTPLGCTNSDTSSVLLYNGPDCEGVIYFPNAFTPNSDGLNDRFRPKQLNIVRFKLLIYNRWGEKVFETDDPSLGWDGTFRGTQCPAGVYVYSSTFGLSLRTDDNGKKDGVVMLIR